MFKPVSTDLRSHIPHRIYTIQLMGKFEHSMLQLPESWLMAQGYNSIKVQFRSNIIDIIR